MKGESITLFIFKDIKCNFGYNRLLRIIPLFKKIFLKAMKNTILGLFAVTCFTLVGSSISATAQEVTQTTETAAKDTIITVKVAGVTCGGDLPVICKYVEKESGILEIKSVGKVAAVSTFEVRYNPAQISFEQVVAKIEDSPSCDAPKKKPFRVKK